MRKKKKKKKKNTMVKEGQCAALSSFRIGKMLFLTEVSSVEMFFWSEHFIFIIFILFYFFFFFIFIYVFF